MDIEPNSTNGWQIKFKPDNGKCFSYQAPKDLHSAVIHTIKLYLKQSLEIYIHHPGQFCTWNSYSLPVQQKQTYSDVSHEVCMGENYDDSNQYESLIPYYYHERIEFQQIFFSDC